MGQLKFIPPSLAGTLCVELLQVRTYMQLQVREKEKGKMLFFLYFF